MTHPKKSLLLALPVAVLLAGGGYAAYSRWRASRGCCPVSAEQRQAKLPPGHPAMGAGAEAAPPLDEAKLSSGKAADCPYLKSQSKEAGAGMLPPGRMAPVEQWLNEGQTQKEGGGSHGVE